MSATGRTGPDFLLCEALEENYHLRAEVSHLRQALHQQAVQENTLSSSPPRRHHHGSLLQTTFHQSPSTSTSAATGHRRLVGVAHIGSNEGGHLAKEEEDTIITRKHCNEDRERFVAAQRALFTSSVSPAVARSILRRNESKSNDSIEVERKDTETKEAERTSPGKNSAEGNTGDTEDAATADIGQEISANETQEQLSAQQQEADSKEAEAPRLLPPYANVPYLPTPSFVHRLVMCLLLGHGTTVLTIEEATKVAISGVEADTATAGLERLGDELMRLTPTLIMLKELHLPLSTSSCTGSTKEDGGKEGASCGVREGVEGAGCANVVLQELFEEHRLRYRVGTRPSLDFVLHRPVGLLQFVQESTSECEYPVTWSSIDSTVCESTSGGTTPVSSILPRPTKTAVLPFNLSQNQEGQYVVLDLRPWLIVPSAYALASSFPIGQGYFPRSWRLEGSLDGENWTLLKRHVNDETLCGGTNFGLWDVDYLETTSLVTRTESNLPASLRHLDPPKEEFLNVPMCFSLFRWVNEGINARGTHHLQISAVELYGRMLFCQGACAMSESPSSYFGNSTSKCFSEVAVNRASALPAIPLMPPLPPEPVPLKKGKGKKKK